MVNQGDSGFTLAGFLLLAALGSFALRSPPLETARPLSPEVSHEELSTDDRVLARLWQDPLTVLRQSRDARASGVSTKSSTDLVPLPELIDTFLRKSDRGLPRQLTVLMVPLTPGPYAELQERRIRRRYAVLSALGDSGFAPEQADFVNIHSIPRTTDGEENFPPLEVPYEWYRYESRDDGSPFETLGRAWPGGLDGEYGEYGEYGASDGKHEYERSHSVVVLWLEESWLISKPYSRIYRLMDTLLPEEKRRREVSWFMLGPAGSGTLRSMVTKREDNGLFTIREKSGLRAFHILSPLATVSDCDLLRQGGWLQSVSCPEVMEESLLGELFSQPCLPDKTCMRFLRTIRSDEEMIRELANELVRRRKIQHDPTAGEGRKNHVVVISEWDTYFGRFLPRTLEQTVSRMSPNNEVLRYTYERGIDGIAPGVRPVTAKKQRPQTGPRTMDPLAEASASIRRPVGTGQFDYLRRLAGQIKLKNEELRHEDGQGIGVVAVLGSDVYDKLLILRALRDQLPGAVWVTTDLDAQLLHPHEYSWTRNLVVASSFDLRLDRRIQSSTPPFRDSYQTAVYLATRMAVKEDLNARLWGEMQEPFPDQQKFYASLPTRLFEVGRNGAVPLRVPTSVADPNDPGYGLRHINQTESASHSDSLMLASALIILLILLAIHKLRPRSGRVILVIIALGGAMLLLGWIAIENVDGGEPLTLQDGVSIWPTEFLRVIVVFLTLIMARSAIYRLRRNWQWLGHRYFSMAPPVSDEGLTLAEILRNLRKFRVRIQPWAVGISLLFIVTILLMANLQGLNLSISGSLLLNALVWGVLLLLWILFLDGRILPSVKVKSINEWDSDTRAQTAGELWSEYSELGQTQDRILRAAGYTIIYFVFGTVVFTLLGGSGAPCRGAACAVDGVLIGVSVVLMLFLLFLVIDAIRLSICWVRKLRREEISWSSSTTSKASDRLNLPEEHAKYWVQIHLIGHRTREVGRLIYYPMLIILLMLLTRSTYFDDWGFPQALAIVIIGNFLIALVGAARLNSVAREAREDILERLRDEQLKLQGGESGRVPEPSLSEIGELIDQLSTLQMGAYQRIWDQPLIRSALLVTGGLGLAYTEYLPVL